MDQLTRILEEAPIVLDGGLSNVLEAQGCELNHKLWTAKLIEENPAAIIEAHLRYLRAGANIITTASYQASFKGLIEEGFSNIQAKELLIRSTELANEAVEMFLELEQPELQPLIAASVGPYGAYLADGSEYRGNYRVSEQELMRFHKERLITLINTKVDLIACETIPSLQEAIILSKLLKKSSKPTWVSFSCRDESRINDGTAIEEVVQVFRNNPMVFAVGVNCTSPQYISGLVSRIKEAAPDKKIVVYPNSGEVYDAASKSWTEFSNPTSFEKLSSDWVKQGVDMIGGCCRIGPELISRLSSLHRHT